MAIIDDFKGIKAACDAISKDICDWDKPDKQARDPSQELEVEFVADTELEAAINTRTRFPDPSAQGKAPNPSPIPPVAKQGRGILSGQKTGAIARYACPRCGSGCAMKPGYAGYGWYCSNCDEFVG